MAGQAAGAWPATARALGTFILGMLLWQPGCHRRECC